MIKALDVLVGQHDFFLADVRRPNLVHWSLDEGPVEGEIAP